MSSVSTPAISISGPIEVVREVAARLSAAGITVSEPTEFDPADVLNSPWNKAKVVAVAGAVTALLEVGAGAVNLAEAITTSLHSSNDQTTVIVIDNATNPTAGHTLSVNSSAAQIQNAIDAAMARA
jgi:hypothetical protein